MSNLSRPISIREKIKAFSHGKEQQSGTFSFATDCRVVRCVTNYRPISILPSFSKFLEKVVYNRLYNYLSKLEILCDNQFGFRKNHSTSLALIDLYEKISLALDRNEHAVGVFLDLSKAFDTVDHNILLDKLEHYGIRGVALDWVRSYLSNRLQFVQFNGQCSSPQTICCGVPQ